MQHIAAVTWAEGSALLGRVWVWIQTNSSDFALVQCNSEQTLHTVRKNSPFTALISQDLGDALVSSEASSKGTKLQKKQVLDCLCCEAFHFHPTRPIYSQYLWHASNLKVNGLGIFHKNAEKLKFQYDIMLFHICCFFLFSHNSEEFHICKVETDDMFWSNTKHWINTK